MFVPGFHCQLQSECTALEQNGSLWHVSLSHLSSALLSPQAAGDISVTLCSTGYWETGLTPWGEVSHDLGKN